MKIECTDLSSLVVNKLPDGSRVIVDQDNATMYALNATAGAAWDACTQPTTLPEVAERMQSSLEVTVTEELAEMAIRQLQENHLVAAPGLLAQTTRRQMIGSLSAAIALPLVVSLTLADQKAYAKSAHSPAPQPPPKKPTPPGWWL
jgi:coenzyme PQQ synthesis protein D (PqqD)